MTLAKQNVRLELSITRTQDTSVQPSTTSWIVEVSSSPERDVDKTRADQNLLRRYEWKDMKIFL